MPDFLIPGDAGERERFERLVVRGPDPDDCHIWRGAIADDGYGRFWVTRDDHPRVLRPHRYALALALGEPLAPTVVAMHLCDNPVCVRAEPREALGDRGSHVVAGTQAENLAGMGAKGRGGGHGLPWRWVGMTREMRAARSRALRDAVRDGWDAEAVRAALLSSDQPTLF
ncbi:hypothetical protein P9990_27075 (plasmid) [Prescottella equi]|uniref:hypothetical protein n=1 Tax=Rhodococcus hoagii TaxID=43767 RepID=UPI0025777061|nr:hypothetical protein [Prescottella equi]WJJ14705.1 hypothetical protein P9990_27075 [Prescottella equi]